MTALLQWLKIAALAWAGAMLVVLVTEIRPLRRLIPDWLRNLSRVVVLAGTFREKEEAQSRIGELKKTFTDCFIKQI